MNKLKLDDLAVESFDTTAEAKEEGGTVFGEQQCTCPTNCTCPGCPTCATCATCGWVSCQTNCNTCDATCGGNQTCWDSCDAICGTYYCTD
ncbi:hypothetical protein [Longimicrobium sp.]|uniref:hypothetical protein n=1 Tax=Longimicrobium sp. TaxID=2029185 RepID=UPI003B3A97C0